MISAFSAVSEGSPLFAFLVLFLCCIFVVICYVCLLGVLYLWYGDVFLTVWCW